MRPLASGSAPSGTGSVTSRLARGSRSAFCVCSAMRLTKNSGSPSSASPKLTTEPNGYPAGSAATVDSAPRRSPCTSVRTRSAWPGSRAGGATAAAPPVSVTGSWCSRGRDSIGRTVGGAGPSALGAGSPAHDDRAMTLTTPTPTATATDGVAELRLDRFVDGSDASIAEHLLVDAPAPVVFAAARGLDLLEVRTPLLTASFWARGLPAKVLGRPEPPPPPALTLEGELGLPGWMLLDQVPDRE